MSVAGSARQFANGIEALAVPFGNGVPVHLGVRRGMIAAEHIVAAIPLVIDDELQDIGIYVGRNTRARANLMLRIVSFACGFTLSLAIRLQKLRLVYLRLAPSLL